MVKAGQVEWLHSLVVLRPHLGALIGDYQGGRKVRRSPTFEQAHINTSVKRIKRNCSSLFQLRCRILAWPSEVEHAENPHRLAMCCLETHDACTSSSSSVLPWADWYVYESGPVSSATPSFSIQTTICTLTRWG